VQQHADNIVEGQYRRPDKIEFWFIFEKFTWVQLANEKKEIKLTDKKLDLTCSLIMTLNFKLLL
jgi:hypothetical protein